MIRKIQYIFILLCLPVSLLAQEKFNIRGVLPWHNFLSGPTGWNLEDYRDYLDECQQYGINFIGFHNYTGGGERYATYVEPMIKIEYKDILPQACFDNSLTARWGYLPMKVKDIAAMEGITPAQAGKSIHAALRRLRRYFARQKWTVNL